MTLDKDYLNTLSLRTCVFHNLSLGDIIEGHKVTISVIKKPWDISYGFFYFLAPLFNKCYFAPFLILDKKKMTNLIAILDVIATLAMIESDFICSQYLYESH